MLARVLRGAASTPGREARLAALAAALLSAAEALIELADFVRREETDGTVVRLNDHRAASALSASELGFDAVD